MIVRIEFETTAGWAIVWDKISVNDSLSVSIVCEGRICPREGGDPGSFIGTGVLQGGSSLNLTPRSCICWSVQQIGRTKSETSEFVRRVSHNESFLMRRGGPLRGSVGVCTISVSSRARVGGTESGGDSSGS